MRAAGTDGGTLWFVLQDDYIPYPSIDEVPVGTRPPPGSSTEVVEKGGLYPQVILPQFGGYWIEDPENVGTPTSLGSSICEEEEEDNLSPNTFGYKLECKGEARAYRRHFLGKVPEKTRGSRPPPCLAATGWRAHPAEPQGDDQRRKELERGPLQAFHSLALQVSRLSHLLIGCRPRVCVFGQPLRVWQWVGHGPRGPALRGTPIAGDTADSGTGFWGWRVLHAAGGSFLFPPLCASGSGSTGLGEVQNPPERQPTLGIQARY
ncbi:Rap1 GTPase-activating protein 2 [Plecturocebus cupreus]